MLWRIIVSSASKQRFPASIRMIETLMIARIGSATERPPATTFSRRSRSVRMPFGAPDSSTTTRELMPFAVMICAASRMLIPSWAVTTSLLASSPTCVVKRSRSPPPQSRLLLCISAKVLSTILLRKDFT